MAQMTAAAKSELKSAGCPDDCVSALEANHDKLAAMGISWSKLVELATKFGPVLWQIISELLKQSPAPVNPNVPPAT